FESWMYTSLYLGIYHREKLAAHVDLFVSQRTSLPLPTRVFPSIFNVAFEKLPVKPNSLRLLPPRYWFSPIPMLTIPSPMSSLVYPIGLLAGLIPMLRLAMRSLSPVAELYRSRKASAYLSALALTTWPFWNSHVSPLINLPFCARGRSNFIIPCALLGSGAVTTRPAGMLVKRKPLSMSC